MKMSKSLKNFITIKEALKDFSGRAIRLMTLAHKWDAMFNYTPKAMPEAVERERKINEFFSNVKVAIRNGTYNKPQKWDKEDFAFSNLHNEIQSKIHLAICDNFDTSNALLGLLELITAANTYMKNESKMKLTLLLKVANYIQYILQCFGVIGDPQLGFGGVKENQVDEETAITPFMNVLSKFRDDIKANAATDPKTIFGVCDKLRDEVLPNLGIRLEDKGKGQPAVWKKEDPAALKADILKKEEEKLLKAEEKKKKAADELKKKMTPASEYFKGMPEKYSQFTAEGLPTHDAKSKPLSAELTNALKKEYAKQDKIHKKWLEDEAKKGGKA